MLLNLMCILIFLSLKKIGFKKYITLMSMGGWACACACQRKLASPLPLKLLSMFHYLVLSKIIYLWLHNCSAENVQLVFIKMRNRSIKTKSERIDWKHILENIFRFLLRSPCNYYGKLNVYKQYQQNLYAANVIHVTLCFVWLNNLDS